MGRKVNQLGKKKFSVACFQQRENKICGTKDASDKTHKDVKKIKIQAWKKRHGHLEKRKRQERNRLTQHQQT